MSSEIFRFLTIRPPQEMDADKAATGVVDLSLAKSALFDSLRKLRASSARSGMSGAVTKFTASADFIDSRGKLDAKLLSFVAAIQRLSDDGFWDNAQQVFTRVFGTAPATYIATEAFTKPYAQIADSIVAATIDDSVSTKVRSLLVRSARALWLIRRLAASAALTRAEFVSAPLALPGGIFPLPSTDVDLKEQQKAQGKAVKAAMEAKRKRLAQLAADLTAHHAAASELLSTFEQTGAHPAANPTTRRVTSAANVKAPAGFLLSDAATKSLSESTKATLKKTGVPATQIDVAKSVTLLEKQSAIIATQLYSANVSNGGMIRIGNTIFPKDALSGEFGVMIDPGPVDNRLPGPCPPAPITGIPTDAVTVPDTIGEARVLGIADLMVLEQELLRYQLGEIAHIENVLKSEARSRKFKTKDTTEQTVITETETTEDKEQDLSSSERFELQTESQTVINQNASMDAGLTIHASYGPSVDATANYNTSSSTSTQQSNSTASNYAREITTKAVDRVQTRTLTRRTTTTTHIIKEVNEHAFDNKDGAADIVGVYRYVDKIYRAQVVNYGKRLMLEFIVPEPAAFLRYAYSNKPVDGVSQIEPERPGYCIANGASFEGLKATDISRDNYLYWASLYGAQDVTTPPPSAIIASGSHKAPDQMPDVGGRLISSDLFDVAIDDGYLCQSAFVNIYGETQSGLHRLVFQLQEQQGEYVEPIDDNHLYYLHLQPTPKLTVTINTNGFHNYEVLVTVFCTLSTDKFQEWQLKTFSSIMNAYNDLKSAYDQAIQEAKLQASDGAVTGTNPESNRVTEQTELKKGCISLLTGQRYELFDAVARNVAPYGYPEIDFSEAKAEGDYIRAFEQSFEWNNMVYLFYPYFWGKKDDWVTIAQITDNDPLFGRFLQAGAARVQVPVRPGFKDAILNYLHISKLWAGDGSFVTSDDDGANSTQLSIIDELKSGTGDNNVDGVGMLNVTKNSAAVSGVDTLFTANDANTRLIVGGATYVIKSVQSATAITLSSPYAGASDTGLGYAMGGKLVGQPWEVKLPTDLIKLDDSLVFG